MVVLGGGAFSYERGTPVPILPCDLEQVLSNARNLQNMKDNFRRALEDDGWSMDHFAWGANPDGQSELFMEWAPLRA